MFEPRATHLAPSLAAAARVVAKGDTRLHRNELPRRLFIAHSISEAWEHIRLKRMRGRGTCRWRGIHGLMGRPHRATRLRSVLSSFASHGFRSSGSVTACELGAGFAGTTNCSARMPFSVVGCGDATCMVHNLWPSDYGASFRTQIPPSCFSCRIVILARRHQALAMVFYFICSDPRYTIYMGRDKYENEHLIQYGWPEDLWFHVDKVRRCVSCD